MSFFKNFDENSDITDITFYNRKRFKHFDKLSVQIMETKSELTRAEKEMIAAYVSSLNNCSYCFGAHKETAKHFNVDVNVFDQLNESIETAEVDKRLKPIFHYVKKLTLTPYKIVKDDYERVINEGWKEETLQDVIAITCMFNFANRLLDGHGIKGNRAVQTFGGQHLAKRGYGVPWFIVFLRSLIKDARFKFVKNFK